ncbi:MAG: hypothetical protein QME42_07535 [bacterium]|nr:hypothetical protein [bacterium]
MTEEKRFEILLEEIRGKFNILIEGQQVLKEYIDRKFEEHEEKEDERFRIIDSKLEGLIDRVVKIEQRLDRIEQRLDRIEQRLDSVEKEIVDIKEKLNTVVTKGDLIVIERRIERLETAVF